ncbi:MAG: hypothetical protein RLZZ181_1006 [Pseudomonadota bacterium]|jgi:hypothetical protein
MKTLDEAIKEIENAFNNGDTDQDGSVRVNNLKKEDAYGIAMDLQNLYIVLVKIQKQPNELYSITIEPIKGVEE